MANFTSDGKHSFSQAEICIAAVNDLQILYTIILLVLNILLTISASVGNALILFALHKETSLHPPSKLLFRCLAATDLLIGLVSQPLHATYLLSLLTMSQGWQENFCVYSVTLATITSNVLCLVSLMTSTAISVDRLLALILGLRYRQVITFKRTLIALILFCLVDIALVSFFHLIYNNNKSKTFVTVALCIGNLATSAFCYAKIVVKIRQHHRQVQTQGSVNQGNCNAGGLAMNMARYKKTVSSVLWIQLTLIICYLPNTVVVAVISNMGLTLALDTAWGITVTLVFLNSSLNPFLYCWKIREIRVAARDTIRQCCSF